MYCLRRPIEIKKSPAFLGWENSADIHAQQLMKHLWILCPVKEQRPALGVAITGKNYRDCVKGTDFQLRMNLCEEVKAFIPRWGGGGWEACAVKRSS